MYCYLAKLKFYDITRSKLSLGDAMKVCTDTCFNRPHCVKCEFIESITALSELSMNGIATQNRRNIGHDYM